MVVNVELIKLEKHNKVYEFNRKRIWWWVVTLQGTIHEKANIERVWTLMTRREREGEVPDWRRYVTVAVTLCAAPARTEVGLRTANECSQAGFRCSVFKFDFSIKKNISGWTEPGLNRFSLEGKDSFSISKINKEINDQRKKDLFAMFRVFSLKCEL